MEIDIFSVHFFLMYSLQMKRSENEISGPFIAAHKHYFERSLKVLC